MSRFSESMRVIPRATYVVAAILYSAIAIALWVGPINHERVVRDWTFVLKILLALLAPLLIFIYTLLVGFVYGDAKRRSMRYVLWTLIAVFVPYCIGIILYFALRSPLPGPCPGCRATVPATFTFCPHCGFALRPTCAQCGKAVESSWANCANCGTQLPKGAPQAAA